MFVFARAGLMSDFGRRRLGAERTNLWSSSYRMHSGSSGLHAHCVRDKLRLRPKFFLYRASVE